MRAGGLDEMKQHIKAGEQQSHPTFARRMRALLFCGCSFRISLVVCTARSQRSSFISATV
jgi:hypothetical protein